MRNHKTASLLLAVGLICCALSAESRRSRHSWPADYSVARYKYNYGMQYSSPQVPREIEAIVRRYVRNGHDRTLSLDLIQKILSALGIDWDKLGLPTEFNLSLQAAIKFALQLIFGKPGEGGGGSGGGAGGGSGGGGSGGGGSGKNPTRALPNRPSHNWVEVLKAIIEALKDHNAAEGGCSEEQLYTQILAILVKVLARLDNGNDFADYD